jgi:ADP-ribose pyrophosphatase YjhB (NUDIX family)
MQMSLSPNAAIPIGLRKKPALDAAAEVQGHAAGVLHIAPDGDVLLLRRAGTPGKDNFVGHWALPGGGVEAGETPQAGAARENKEEMGVDVDPDALRDLDKTMTPNGMAFHTFAHPVAKKFSPQLNDEHSGAGWFGLHELPHPMHPAVEKMLQDKLGIGADSKPEEFAGARDGLMMWAKNPDIADDCALASDSIRPILNRGNSFVLAFDKASVREIDDAGRLHVGLANICKACVSPYRGSEIPNWQNLGLDPERVYQLFRDPTELEKATPTANGIQILRKHTPVSAEDHQPWDVVGAVGTTAQWNDPYVQNGLTIWPAADIAGVDSGEKRELSPGYRYVADMSPGNFKGQAYDGVMREISFNHLAIVEDGRQGTDIIIGDSNDEMNWSLIERALVSMAR